MLMILGSPGVLLTRRTARLSKRTWSPSLGDKLECLRYWPKENTKPDFTYKSPDGTEKEEKEHLRDLGVQIASDLTFSVHIQNTVTSANRLVGWALRTFRRRSRL